MAQLKGNDAIRVAVTYADGNIFQHFGQTKQFKIYDIDNGAVTAEKVVSAGDYEHCSLGSFLYENGVTVLICGNLGAGASKSLQAAGILVYGGNSGDADTAVAKLLRQELIYDPTPSCHDHDCGHHDSESAGHNHFEGGHNHKETENAGHNDRTGYER